MVATCLETFLAVELVCLAAMPLELVDVSNGPEFVDQIRKGSSLHIRLQDIITLTEDVSLEIADTVLIEVRLWAVT